MNGSWGLAPIKTQSERGRQIGGRVSLIVAKSGLKKARFGAHIAAWHTG